MAIYINDIKVEQDPYTRRYRLEYGNRAVMIERVTFDLMYDRLEPRQLYNFIKREYFNETKNMMYDEYFGTDDVAVHESAAEIARKKAESAKNGKQQTEKNRIAHNRKQLGITFWGALIVGDLMNGDNNS